MNYIITSGDCELLNIDTIGYSKNTKVTKFGPAQRNQYILHFVISGKGYFNGNEVCEGEGFVITPTLLEHYFPDKDNPWEFIWVISTDDRFKNILKILNYNEKSGIFKHKATENLKTIVQTLKFKNNQIISSYEALEMFLNILKTFKNADNRFENKSNKELYLDVAVNYIRNNIALSVNVNTLTDILGISQTYLHRIFKENFGVSTKQYISNYRLNEAKKLLIETELSITQIAASVGFSDVLSFSKFFSEKVGISPQNYRCYNKKTS